MSWRYTPYLLPLIASAAIAVGLIVRAWPRRREPAVAALVVLMAAVSLWSLANALEIASVRLDTMILLANAQYTGIVAIPIAWYLLARAYGGQPLRSWRSLLCLSAIPLITLALVWTNPWHGLIRQNVRLDDSGPFIRTAKTYGPWFYVQLVYSYSLVAAGMAIVVRSVSRAQHLYRWQVVLMLVGVTLPWAANAAYVATQHRYLYVDPTPIAFAVTGVVVAVGMLRFGLLDLAPAARDAVFESMADAVLVLDTRSRIVDYNPAAAALLGRDAARALGEPAAALLPPLGPVLEGRLPTGAEINLAGEGATGRYAVSLSPLQSRTGRPSGLVVLLHDVSQARALEEQLRQTQKMEAVGRLAGGIAHHFNNLLTVVNGYSEFVSDSLGPDNPLRPDVEAIHRAGRHAAELTRQLLVFSRPRRPDPEVVQLNEVVAQMDRMLRMLLTENVTVQLDLAPELAPVNADPRLMEQVVATLVTNACDAMPMGGTLTISTRNRLRPDGTTWVEMVVSDTGMGMPAEIREHLFEPFFTTKAVGEGTGLGLATVHGIVQEAGGEIAVESEPGRGTTFRICLPTVREQPAAAADEPPHPTPQGKGERILLVEDEEGVRAFVSSALRRLGYEVIESADGAQALERWRTERPPVDLVLTDVVMPGLNGPEMVKRLRQRRQALRVLYMSGHSDEAMGLAHLADSPDNVLRKPFAIDLLAHRVRQALDTAET